MKIPETLPWSISNYNPVDQDVILSNDKREILGVNKWIRADYDDLNYIIKACNNFPKALELLKLALEQLSDYNAEPESDIRFFLKSLE